MPNDFTTINNPIPAEWQEFITMSEVGLEVIPDQLYSQLTYTDNTTTNLEFFATKAANAGLSNMTQGGLLPNPQSFLIEAICVRYPSVNVQTIDQGAAGALASQANDILLLQNLGRATLVIGEKKWGPWKIWTMPSPGAFRGFSAGAGAEAANLVSQYAEPAGAMWVVQPKIMIPPLVNFQLNMQWPAAVDLSADIDIETLFFGKRARGIQ